MAAKGTTTSMSTNTTKIEDGEWVNTLALIIDEFRKINQDITANQMLVLLRIGEHPGITQNKLAEATGLRDGTISRICALMSERGHQGRDGLNVISINPVPGDYRAKGQSLINGGKKLYASVKHLMTASR